MNNQLFEKLMKALEAQNMSVAGQYVINCPHHFDHNPSLVVWNDEAFCLYCHARGTIGNLFSVLMRPKRCGECTHFSAKQEDDLTKRLLGDCRADNGPQRTLRGIAKSCDIERFTPYLPDDALPNYSAEAFEKKICELRPKRRQ